MRILGRNNSVNVIKVLWCAAELGLDVDRIDIGGAFGGNDQPEYLAKNPMASFWYIIHIYYLDNIIKN